MSTILEDEDEILDEHSPYSIEGDGVATFAIDPTTPNTPGSADGNNPDIDPADEGTLIGILNTFRNKLLQNIDGMLPARVIAYNRDTNRVQVQPLIAVLTTDGSVVNRGQVASLPVLQLGAGNVGMLFNLVEGDLGWIVANDRDISLFLQTYSQAQPNTLRKKSFSDALFIPDVMRGYTIATEDKLHFTIQNKAGTVRMAFWDNLIKITAPLGLYVEGPIQSSGAITPDAPPPTPP